MTITYVLGAILLVALLGVDIWFAADKVPGNTWSEVIRSWGRVTPVVPWICGVLNGHFFPAFHVHVPQPWNFIALILLTLAVVLTGMFARGSIPPWIMLLPAYVAGTILWSR